MFFNALKEQTETIRQGLFAVPVIIDALHGKITLAQYVAFLTQAYHHVKHTVPLLMACGSRLPARYGALRNAIAHYIEEEIGHEEWILQDIAACGGDIEEARASQPSLATELMIAYAYHVIDRGNPLAFFGMVHVLEGTSMALATNAADIIRKQLALPASAFTYLTSHGSLDIEHVAFFEKLMDGITDEQDQADIIHGAHAFFRLYGDIFRSLPRE
ncbi:MAG: iron-containing redox enzyme family protein [Sulfuricellaceae bacterium]|nr:iron-containing redox enzyme family protein [Sulfuricellaceae bacterium]